MIPLHRRILKRILFWLAGELGYVVTRAQLLHDLHDMSNQSWDKAGHLPTGTEARVYWRAYSHGLDAARAHLATHVVVAHKI